MLIFRLNSLYVYDKKEDDCPRQFWLLSTVKELVQLDSDEQEYLLGGFQLEFVSISRVINHMTCNKSSALIGWNYSIQTGEKIL